MSIEQDKEDLLDALYARHLATGKRPSIVEAQMHYLPEWDRDRMWDAAQALEAGGDILNPSPGVVHVDLSSRARKRAHDRTTTAASQVINIGNNYQSPVQQVAPGGHGNQTTRYNITKNDLQKIIDIYRSHVEELKFDPATRQRADAQVATIEAQLKDEPNPTIINVAGKSLKAIVEGALGSAVGGVIANAGVWAPLFSLFG